LMKSSREKAPRPVFILIRNGMRVGRTAVTRLYVISPCVQAMMTMRSRKGSVVVRKSRSERSRYMAMTIILREEM
jgi:hypothetical protein